MAAIFKYNNKLIQAINLEKKLKKLKIDKSDIDLLWEGDADSKQLDKIFAEMTSIRKNDDEDDVILYKFTNGKDFIHSIYQDLNHLGDIANGYVQC